MPRVKKDGNLCPSNLPYKRLKFLEDFCNALNLNHADIARITGMTPPSVSHWFAVDDIKLSIAQDLIEGAGFSFNISLTREDEVIDQKIAVDLTRLIDLDEDGQYIPTRLSFLSLALHRYGIKKYQLASMMNVQYGTVKAYFANDDIYLGRLFQIAEVCGFSVIINMEKLIDMSKEDIPADGTRPRHYISTLVIESDVEM